MVDLLHAMGYGKGDEDRRRVTKMTGDDGIDGVIDEDRLGLDAVYDQAKNYGPSNKVGRPALQRFSGSLTGQRASKGVFITEESEAVPIRNEYGTGAVQSTGFLLDGAMHGEWSFFRKDGSVMRTGRFDRGRQVGTWRTFDRAGRLVKETEFPAGR